MSTQKVLTRFTQAASAVVIVIAEVLLFQYGNLYIG